MPSPKKVGDYLYKKIWKDYDDDWGAAVVGVIGGQGSVKTACCLDIAEKKLETHPREKIFWHDTIGSPCQFRKAKFFPYKIFIEKGLDLEFYNISNSEVIKPDVAYFSNVAELYENSEYLTINVVYFKNKKGWVGYKENPCSDDELGLIEYLMGNNEWQTIIFDEMETLFPADVNNQSEDRWWDWTTKVAKEKIKECRKSRVGVVGNFHDPNAIYYSVLNKFMFHIWGFGSRPKKTRIKQACVDQLDDGMFWIDHQGSKFGKIKVKNIYSPPKEQWIARII